MACALGGRVACALGGRVACALSVEAQSGGIGERDRGAKHRRHEMIIEGRYVKADKDGKRDTCDRSGGAVICRSICYMCFLSLLHSVTACRQSVRPVFDLGCVVAYYAVLIVDAGVAS